MFPIVEKYKYLGIWIDETLASATHLKMLKPKITYLTNKLKIIPKRNVTPKFILNLWTLIIRPIFDYSICVATLLQKKTEIKEFITAQGISLKKALGLKMNTQKIIIKDLMGYDTEEFANYLIRNARTKWQTRVIKSEAIRAEKTYKLKTNPLLLNWYTFKLHNILWKTCKPHNCFLTQQHILDFHKIDNLPNITKLLQEGFEINSKIQEAMTKRGKSKLIKKILDTQNKHKLMYELINPWIQE